MAGEMVNPTWAPGINSGDEQPFVSLNGCTAKLFDEQSEAMCSPVFTVPSNGDGVLLSAFGNCCDLGIYKVLMETQDMPHSKGECCMVNVKDHINPQAAENADSVDQGCGSWALSLENNTGVLTLPGSYVVCTCDENCLGEFVLTAEKIKAAAVANLPRNLIFGSE